MWVCGGREVLEWNGSKQLTGLWAWMLSLQDQWVLQMLRAGLCWTPTDHITPVDPVLAASKGLPAKREGAGTDGLEPGKESLDRLAAFQGSWTRASDVRTSCTFPRRGRTAYTCVLGSQLPLR